MKRLIKNLSTATTNCSCPQIAYDRVQELSKSCRMSSPACTGVYSSIQEI
jgi:hypothetical protein